MPIYACSSGCVCVCVEDGLGVADKDGDECTKTREPHVPINAGSSVFVCVCAWEPISKLPRS